MMPFAIPETPVVNADGLTLTALGTTYRIYLPGRKVAFRLP